MGNCADEPWDQTQWSAIAFDDVVVSTSYVGLDGTTPSPYCGDSSCNNGETCSTCPGDCGSCQTCGNSIREGSEACDGTDLTGQTCISRGFTGGTLACLSSCSGFDTSGCTSSTCPNGVCDPGETCSSCPQDCGSCLPTQEKFIFHDSLPAGADILQGDPMEVSTESPYQGTNSLKITGQGAWSNCRIVNLNTDVSAINWNSAYLEFALKSSVPSGYVAVNLWGDGTHSPEQAFSLSGSGQYETFRINMTDFSPTQPGFGNAITQFMIGTSWGSGNPVYLDEIRIASPGQCAHKSDSDCNGCVDMSELTAFIDRWKINNQDVTLKELIESIGLWKIGGCP